MNGLIGRKLGMTPVFDAAGTHVPVTVIEAGPCPVISVAEGRAELGFGAKKAKRTPRRIDRSTYAALVRAVPPAMPVICPKVLDVRFPFGLAKTGTFRIFPASIRASSRL